MSINIWKYESTGYDGYLYKWDWSTTQDKDVMTDIQRLHINYDDDNNYVKDDVTEDI